MLLLMLAENQANASASATPVRLTDRHFPGSYDDKKYKPDCVVCQQQTDKAETPVQSSSSSSSSSSCKLIGHPLQGLSGAVQYNVSKIGVSLMTIHSVNSANCQ